MDSTHCVIKLLDEEIKTQRWKVTLFMLICRGVSRTSNARSSLSGPECPWNYRIVGVEEAQGSDGSSDWAASVTHRCTAMGKKAEVSCVFWISPGVSLSVTFVPCSCTPQGPPEGQEEIYAQWKLIHAF